MDDERYVREWIRKSLLVAQACSDNRMALQGKTSGAEAKLEDNDSTH